LPADEFVNLCSANNENTEFVKSLLNQRVDSFLKRSHESGENPLKDFNTIVAGAEAIGDEYIHGVVQRISAKAIQEVDQALDVLEKSVNETKSTGTFESDSGLLSDVG
jgi:hypothetical protein